MRDPRWTPRRRRIVLIWFAGMACVIYGSFTISVTLGLIILGMCLMLTAIMGAD